MLKITEPAASVNRSKTRDVRRDATRLRQLRRILTLIDIMAPCRLFHATEEIRCHLCERLGERVHQRTFLRDLHLLESLGMAERQAADYCPRSRRFRWRLNLRCSESAQCAAIKLEAAEALARLRGGEEEARIRRDLAEVTGSDGGEGDMDGRHQFDEPGDAAASDKQVVVVHLMEYTNERGERVWFNQSMDADTADAMRKRFEARGRSPVLHSLQLSQDKLEKLGAKTIAAGARNCHRSRTTGRPPIAAAIDQWFSKVVEAHGLGLIDDLHEIARLAEACRQFAQSNCELDPFWESLCLQGDEFLQEEFDTVWRDVTCESSPGKCDTVLGIGTKHSEVAHDSVEEAVDEREPEAKASDAFYDESQRFDLFMVTEDQARRTSVGVSKQVAVTVTERFNEPGAQLFMWPSDAELPAWLTAILVDPGCEDCSEWRILTCDAITGDVYRGSIVLTKQEAMQHIRAWDTEKEKAIAIPWPAWAPEPVIRVPVED